MTDYAALELLEGESRRMGLQPGSAELQKKTAVYRVYALLGGVQGSPFSPQQLRSMLDQVLNVGKVIPSEFRLQKEAEAQAEIDRDAASDAALATDWELGEAQRRAEVRREQELQQALEKVCECQGKCVCSDAKCSTSRCQVSAKCPSSKYLTVFGVPNPLTGAWLPCQGAPVDKPNSQMGPGAISAGSAPFRPFAARSGAMSRGDARIAGGFWSCRAGGARERQLRRRRTPIIGARPIARLRNDECPPGFILRAPYRRHSRSGISAWLGAACIRARGLSGVLGRPAPNGVAIYKMKRPHLLRDHGYSENAPSVVRRRAIEAAVAEEGGDALRVIRHMGLIAIRSRNRETNREGVRNLAADLQWAGRRYGFPGYARGTLLKQIRTTSSSR